MSSGIAGVLQFVRSARRHELGRRNEWLAIRRFLGLQLSGRLLRRSFLVPFVNETHIFVRPGLTGANGNFYFGLMEFRDMAFVGHVLRAGDVFVDVGANIGSYTLLASGVCGATTYAFEAADEAFAELRKNVEANSLEKRVTTIKSAVGNGKGVIRFSTGRDTMNSIVPADEPGVDVPMTTLAASVAIVPRLIKIDTEGFDADVVAGAASLLAGYEPMAILVELGPQRGAADECDLARLVTSCGFERMDYDPFARRLKLLGDEQTRMSNALFVRDPDFFSERTAGAAPLRLNSGLIV